MRLRVLSLSALVVGLSACVEQIEAPNGRVGSISVTAFSDGGVGNQLNLEAAFFGQTDLDFALPTTDTCFIAQFVPTNTINTGFNYLNAGDFLTVRTGSRVDSMRPVVGLPVRVYESSRSRGIPYTPGDSVAVDVPGSAAFPTSSISVKTSESFTHAPIPVPAEGADILASWTAAPSAGSTMTYSLRYANSFSSGAQNEQLVCSFVDDGAATIPSGFLVGWRGAQGGNRGTVVTRIRSRQLELDARTRLLMVSTYSQPLDVLTP
ncbi:MAG: hypothetical protein ACKVS7_15975 [Gemmatimonadaceae bacterium]